MNTDGLVHVTRADGSSFKTSPLNIGVESELYTRFAEDGTKDVSVEEWFAETIDAPVRQLIDHLLDTSIRRRFRMFSDEPPPKMLAQIGTVILPYVDVVPMPDHIKDAMTSYVAALTVRNPRYLRKLAGLIGAGNDSARDLKNLSLDQMLVMYERFRENLREPAWGLSAPAGKREFLFADGGVLVDERWNTTSGIPFEILAPLTPELAISAFPVPPGTRLPPLPGLDIALYDNTGMARFNRTTLASAQRLVFSKSPQSSEFIKENFGKLPPQDLAYRVHNGVFEWRWSHEVDAERLNAIKRK